MTCFIIALISMQREIFRSAGFKKYTTQKNSSMHMLVQIAVPKAKAITQMFNNAKIQKIVSIQKRREIINNTIERLKDKINNWRIGTRKMLDKNYDKIVEEEE
jgi:hypothetical protein